MTTPRPSRPLRCVLLCAAVLLAPALPASGAPADYPTEALADYVFACMAVNGQTPDALRRCSCSIERIAQDVPYEDYVKADTVLRMQRAVGGEDRVAMFRQSAWAQAMIDTLRAAQVAAESECF